MCTAACLQSLASGDVQVIKASSNGRARVWDAKMCKGLLARNPLPWPSVHSI